MYCLSGLRLSVAVFFLTIGLIAKADSPQSTLIVDLYINYQQVGDSFVLQDSDGYFFVEEEVLELWRIEKPWPTPVVSRGRSYLALQAFEGVEFEYNPLSMELQVYFPASLMPLSNINIERNIYQATSAGFGTYLDYDFNWTDGGSGGDSVLRGLFRPVIFGSFGTISSTLNYSDYQYQTSGFEKRDSVNVLDLVYTFDDQESMRSIKVGDFITRPGSQGRALRVGGIQISTNFTVQPGFITYPLPEFFGETAVPTALDVYVNGQLRRTEEVDAGRYHLSDLPATAGAGQIQITTIDALGRQQVFSQDFYTSINNLKEGLSDYSFSVGALREEYGLQNFKYGDLAASATWRYGLSNDLTIEGHGEHTNDLSMVGGGVQYIINNGGSIKAGLGVSNSELGTGSKWQLGFNQINNLLSYNLEVSGATENFDFIGSNYYPLPKTQVLAGLGKSFYRYGSFNLSVVHQEFYRDDSRTFVRASHNIAYRNAFTISSFVSYSDDNENNVTGGISFNMSFGTNSSANSAVLSDGDNVVVEAQYRKNVPVGTGFGYQIGAVSGDNKIFNAGTTLQNEVGTYTLDVLSSENGGTSWQAGMSGSVAYLDGMTSFSRRIRDAFAVVDVGDFENVRVYLDNQEVGRTNKKGKVFVPGLIPYYNNSFRIETDDLPLNAYVKSSQSKATPFYRSGVVVNFEVNASTNVILNAIFEDGMSIPEGATVKVSTQNYTSPVGLDGMIFLQGIDEASEVEIYWEGMNCLLELPEFSIDEMQVKINDVICKLL